MANPNGQQIKIDLGGNLNLNELKSEIHSFEGFNKRNTQILGNGLKPYYQHIDETDEQVIYDRNEDKWTVNNETKKVYRNNSVIFDADAAERKIFKEKNSGNVCFKLVQSNREIFNFIETNNKIYVKEHENYSDDFTFIDYVNYINADLNTVYVVALKNDDDSFRIKIQNMSNYDNLKNDYFDTNIIADSIVKFSANLCEVFVSGEKKNLIICELQSNTQNYIYGLLIDDDCVITEGAEIAGISQNKFKLNPLVKETDATTLNPEFFKYFFTSTSSTAVIAKIGNNCEWSAGTLTNITDKDFTSFRNGSTSNNFAPGGQVVCEEENLCGFRVFHVIQGLTVAEGEEGKPIVYVRLSNFEGYPMLSQRFTQESVSYATIEDKLVYIQTGYTTYTYGDMAYDAASNSFVYTPQTGYIPTYVSQIVSTTKYKNSTGYYTSIWEKLRGCVNIKLETIYGFNYLINFNGDKHSVTGLSFGDVLVTRWGGIDNDRKPILTRFEQITFEGKDIEVTSCNYVSENEITYKLLVSEDIPIKIQYIFNRYIITNILELTYNAYDILKNEKIHYADDWNNRLIIKNLKVGDNASKTNMDFASIASGENQMFQINSNSNVRSAIFAPIYGYVYYDNTDGNNVFEDNIIDNAIDVSELSTFFNKEIDFYYTFSETVNPFYKWTYSGTSKYYKAMLKDVMYTVAANNNIYLSPDILASYKQLSNNDWVISSDENSYIVIKYDFENQLLYKIGTLIQNIDDIFSIQGQFYAIKNNTLYLITISEGIITSNSIIYYLQDLQFIGATLQYALFYSPKQKSVYVFSGDRKLELLGATNEIDYVNTYFYDNSQNTLFIGCDKFILCYKDSYFWKIYIPDVKQFYFTDRGIEFIADDKIGLIHNYYHADDKAEMEHIPIELETAFYGFGQNRIGIIDCWTLRLYSTDKAEGKIKLRVTSLTDKGTEGEEREITLRAEDWDKVTSTYLLRFQPRLQRGIGLSLAIESDFELYDLQVSATPDTALQITNRREI